MRIVIDLQGAQTESRFRGIGRYTMSLAQAIVRNRGEHEVLLALSGLFPDTIEPIRAAFDGLLPQENIRVWHALGPVKECEQGNEWRREVAEIIREAFLASLHPDVVLVTSLFEGYIDDAVTSIGVFAPRLPTAAILYDLIPMLNPELYLEPNPRYQANYVRKIESLKTANLWLSISESAAQEGREVLDLAPDCVVNISTACDAGFKPLDISEEDKQKLAATYGISQPFVLYSGGADDRKNLPRLIQAYANLPATLRQNHQLVFAGKMPQGNVDRLKQEAGFAGLGTRELIFTGYVSDDQLAQLYNLCKVFVFPSIHEGFGLPALEAMACGAPVIGSNTSSVPEVIGRTDALFDPYDEAAMSQKLCEVLENADFRTELVSYGLKRAKKFSWHDSAKNAIAAFEAHFLENIYDLKHEKEENIQGSLIQEIASLMPANIDDAEVLKLAHAIARIPSGNAKTQILVDISELVRHDAKTGVQRVTRSILNELLENSPPGYVVEPVYATADRIGYRYARQFITHLHGLNHELGDEPIEFQSGDIFLGLDLQHHVVAAQKEYLSSLRQDGVSVFFIVYDLLPVLMPDFFLPGMDVVHKSWLEALSCFDGAICISCAVANELREWQKNNGPQRLRPFKIGWFHLGADIQNSLPTQGLPDNVKDVFEQLTIRPTFLMVGTIEPRKGHTQALAAFEQLWKDGVAANLVIVGKSGWMVEAFVEHLSSHPELNKRLFWLEGISDEYLEKVYAVATCLLVASEGEGFGLPLIEAAQHNLPIITRDIPVFREVAGDHAFYFSGKTPDELAAAVQEWLGLYGKGKNPPSDDMPWLTWQQSAANLLKQLF